MSLSVKKSDSLGDTSPYFYHELLKATLFGEQAFPKHRPFLLEFQLFGFLAQNKLFLAWNFQFKLRLLYYTKFTEAYHC